jgi:hypothetical protein
VLFTPNYTTLILVRPSCYCLGLTSLRGKKIIT